MKNFLSNFDSLSSRAILVSPCFVLVMGLAYSPVASAEPAEVFLGELIQEYDGDSKLPSVSTDPPGLPVALAIVPRSQAEVIYETNPGVSLPSYESIGLQQLTDMGFTDKALGEEKSLGGHNRFLDSIEVTMVNFARAARWPALALENPEGYRHPLSLSVFGVAGNSLFIVAEETKEFLVPWSPATLDDGSEYPFGGKAFKVRFNFNQAPRLFEKIVVLLSYNTRSSGFQPIGVAGPYDSLNLAMLGDPPLVGADVDSERMVRFSTVLSRSRAFGRLAPLFTVRTFPGNPAEGAAVDAGEYRVQATINASGFDGEALADFQVTPLDAGLVLSGLRQVADGSPKAISVTTSPDALAPNVVYARRSGPPVERGLYPVFVTLAAGNYFGSRSQTMRLGYSYETWMAGKVSEGGVVAALAGRSDDPDFDGRTNLQEYLAASDPANPNDAAKSLTEFVRTAEGGFFTFARNNEAGDVGHQVQFTNNLADPGQWMNLALPEGATNPLSPSERIEVPVEIMPGTGARFYRVKYEILATGG